MLPKDIAIELNMRMLNLTIALPSVHTILNRLKNRGMQAAICPKANKSNYSSQFRLQIVLLAETGMSPIAIAQKLGMPENSVYSILKRLKERGVEAAIGATKGKTSATKKEKKELFESHMLPDKIVAMSKSLDMTEECISFILQRFKENPFTAGPLPLEYMWENRESNVKMDVGDSIPNMIDNGNWSFNFSFQF